MKARSSWLMGSPNARLAAGSARCAVPAAGFHDHVADDRVHQPHLLRGAHADEAGGAVPGDEAAGTHHGHDHLRRLADAAGRIELQEPGEAQHLGAVLHGVALGQAGAGQERRGRDAEEQEEGLGPPHRVGAGPRRQRARVLQVLPHLGGQPRRRLPGCVPHLVRAQQVGKHVVGVAVVHQPGHPIGFRVGLLAKALEERQIEGGGRAEDVSHPAPDSSARPGCFHVLSPCGRAGHRATVMPLRVRLDEVRPDRAAFRKGTTR